jgi:hypothetical protein
MTESEHRTPPSGVPSTTPPNRTTEHDGTVAIADVEVLTALDQTGFLLEQRVAQLFDSLNDFEVEANVPYRDRITGKSREIDVVADYTNFAGDSRIGAPFVRAGFIAECKNSRDPFVVIGVASKGSRLHYRNCYLAAFDPLKMGWNDIFDTISYLKLYNVDGVTLSGGFKGRQLVKLQRQQGKWRANNAGIFDSIVYPLAKATESQMSGLESNGDYEEDYEHPSFHFFHSLLITCGPIYTVSVSKDESRVQQVPWAPFVRAFNDDDLKGDYLFEIVEYRHLKDYIERRAMRFIHGVEKLFIDHGRVFNPSWLLRSFGEPRDLEAFNDWRKVFERKYGA